jgi:hypothetical protein
MNKVQRMASCSSCSEHRQDFRIRRSILLLFAVCTAMSSPGLWASEAFNLYDQLYTKGTGSVFLNYQYIDVSKFQNGVDEVPIGEVRTQSLYLQVDYAVAERWRLELGIPYIWKRASGATTHDPATLDPPHPEVSFIDDGKYRSTFQDFYFAVDYLWINTPVRVEPFVHVLIPSHDYQFFANSAVGQNLWRVEIGLELTHLLPFSDWYYRLGGGYTIVEKTLGVNVNHFRLNAEVGYFLTPSFSLNVFGFGRKGNGNSAQAFPPSKRTDEAWFQHDRTTRHSSANVGIGADWFFHEDYQLSADAFTTVWGDSVHWIDFAGELGITRYF